MNGLLHLHTEHSIKESIITIPKLIRKAKELGMSYLAITDINTMTGAIEFYNACKKNDIKPILGVEVSLGEAGSVVALAKNMDGYKNISVALTETAKKCIGGRFAMFFSTFDGMVKDGNVIILSSDYFYQIQLHDEVMKEECDKISEQQKRYVSPTDAGLVSNLDKIKELSEEIEALEASQKELKKIAQKKYTKPKSALEAMKGSITEEQYQTKVRDLERQMAESKDAAVRCDEITSDLKNLKRLRTTISKKTEEMKKQTERWVELEAQKTAILNKLRAEDADARMEKAVLWFSKKLGDNFYIELQNHGPEEAVMKTLAGIAEKYHIPTIVSNTPCMIEKDDYLSLQVMRSLQENRWIKATAGDDEHYIKSEAVLLTSLKSICPETMFNKSLFNMDRIADSCAEYDFSTSHYPKYRITEGTAEDTLRNKTYDGLKARGLSESEVKERIEYELGVICRMGFADYLLIVQDYIQYGKSLDKYGVGPGRGSAAGSLVCYCLGITNINPLLYGLKFERFLNVERVSMPDIDVDFAPTIRGKMIEYVSQKYGADSVSMIRTKLTQGAKAAIRNVARILGSRDYGDPKYFLALGDRMAKAVPNKPGICLADVKDAVLEASDDKENGNRIYEIATKVENLMTGLSVHAAGVIIGDGNPLCEYVPLIYNTDLNVWAASYDMVEVEQIGLLKMDFLGLRNLSIISECVERINKYTGKKIDLDTIPYEPEVFEHIFSEGNTESVFQFESIGMRNMLMKFKPSSFEDIILLIAAYRPGPMDSIPDIIDVKHGNKTADYCVPELAPILDATYGFPIYQEQLMDIFATCAGFTAGEADVVRRNMSKKKIEKFKEAKPQFIEGLIQHGASKEDAEKLWDSLVSFSAYAFNKSHAAAYAQISYQMAWLKYHYKEYYMCSVLNWTAGDKLEAVLYNCKKMDVSVLLPDINRSGSDFENSTNGIYYGLSRIKSVKSQVMPLLEGRPYTSFADCLFRNSTKGKIKRALIETLIYAGVFDNFLPDRSNRNALLDAIPKIEDCIKKAYTVQKQMSEIETAASDPKAERKKKEKYVRLEEKYREALAEMEAVSLKSMDEDDSLLKKEHELLYAYISKHPLHAYEELYKQKGICLIADFQPGELRMIGMIRNLRIHNRKSDGSPMAFFDLEDVSDVIAVSCFANEYKEYSGLIAEGNVIDIRGKGVTEDGYNEGETENRLVARRIAKARPFRSPIFLSISSRAEERELYDFCCGYEDEAGHPVYVHYQDTGEICRKNMFIRRRALEDLPEQFYGHLLFESQKKSYL